MTEAGEVPPTAADSGREPSAACWLALSTAPDGAAAERLARALVRERLAACVNLVRGVRSVYRWQGRIEEDGETLLLMKTTAAGLGALRRRLLVLHPYDTPEFLAFEVGEGSPEYLRWVADSVRPR